MSDAQASERYLPKHPRAIDLWIGGHTHTDAADVTKGHSHIMLGKPARLP